MGLQFPALPKDYAGLCRLQLPRPVHDRVEYANVAEVTDAMALSQDDFTADQRDYFDLLCELLEDHDRAHLRWPKVGVRCVSVISLCIMNVRTSSASLLSVYMQKHFSM
jgi:hypothetical protein